MLDKLKSKTLAIFFTLGMSLRKWNAVGNIGREADVINGLAGYFKHIYLITYGNEQRESLYRELFLGNVTIISKQTYRLNDEQYNWAMPLLLWKVLKEADFYRTIQMPGAKAAVRAKNWYKKKLFLRCGYEWLRSAQGKNEPRAILQKKRKYEEYCYQRAEQIIISSQESKEYIEREFPFTLGKVQYVPNAVNIKHFSPQETAKEKGRIIYIGRLEPLQKNVFNLIEAIAGLEVKLIVVGSGRSKDELERLAKAKGLHVEFRGNIPGGQLPDELNRSQIFILPSLFEGNPKVLLEAMSCALPCIACDVVGNREIVVHKENGYLCQPDVQSLHEAIKAVMGDQALQAKMGKNARQTILKHYNLNDLIKKEAAVYNKIVSAV